MNLVVEWCNKDFRYYDFDAVSSYRDNVSIYFLESYIDMGTLCVL